MITLSEIVLRLRSTCLAFQFTMPNPRAAEEGQPPTVVRSRVGGSADFGAALDSLGADLPVPHAFVTPLYGQDVSEFNLSEQVAQTIRQYFAVIVCLDNSKDGGAGGAGGRGDLAELDQLAVIQGQLSAAFQGWKPIQRFGPVRYNRDMHLQMDNKRLWHQFEWYVEFISDPTSTPETEAILEEILGGMDIPVAYEDSILANLVKLNVQAHEMDGINQTVTNPPWWDDFFGHVFCPPHKTDEEVDALRPNYHDLDVNPDDHPQPPEVIRDAMDNGIDYVEPPVPIEPEFWHGEEVKEDPEQ